MEEIENKKETLGPFKRVYIGIESDELLSIVEFPMTHHGWTWCLVGSVVYSLVDSLMKTHVHQ